MPRRNVWIPDELDAAVREAVPGLNLSAVVQEALERLLGCDHAELACARCSTRVERAELADAAASELLQAIWWELGDLVHRGGTAEGSARVVLEVARRRNVSGAKQLVLPRLTRSERARLRAAG